MRRVVAVEVESAFADRDHARLPCELPQARNRLLVTLAGVVRMDSGGAEESLLESLLAFLDGGAGHDALNDAGLARAGEHFRQVFAKGRMCKICTDINELHRARSILARDAEHRRSARSRDP